jgi:hypothetical protein
LELGSFSHYFARTLVWTGTAFACSLNVAQSSFSFDVRGQCFVIIYLNDSWNADRLAFILHARWLEGLELPLSSRAIIFFFTLVIRYLPGIFSARDHPPPTP